MLSVLYAVFQSLREAKLVAKPSKCFVGYGELEFLGHIAGSGNIKPVQDKVSAIRQFPVPVTKKQMNSCSSTALIPFPDASVCKINFLEKSGLRKTGSLQRLHKMKTSNQWLLRWSLILQEFSFTISYIAGKTNIVADVLSRCDDI
jgi:hypothetical protein